MTINNIESIIKVYYSTWIILLMNISNINLTVDVHDQQ